MLKIDIIAGARPNFMKIAPVVAEINRVKEKGYNITFRLIHTGQHYDKAMSEQFFEQLQIPKPDVNLGVGSGTQAEQTARIMMGYEELLMKKPCDICIVVGDVTSTMACSIAAKKLLIPVAHIEAGIRSGDRTMPEEINRIVTDSITDFFFTTSQRANGQLKDNGVAEDSIFFVGNTMIDTLMNNLSRLQKPDIWDKESLSDRNYLVMTLHRPANVDEVKQLDALINEIMNNTEDLKVIFPVHPRTRKSLEKISVEHERLIMTDPMGYLEFIYLVKNAKAVITDSGGITEEATVLNVPCLTLRDNTERPETVEIGTNVLVGTKPEAIKPWLQKLFSGEWKKGKIPELWDGHTAERIVAELLKLQSESRI